MDREFEKLNEIAKHIVDNVRDIGKLNESASVSMTGKASAADRAVSKPL